MPQVVESVDDVAVLPPNTPSVLTVEEVAQALRVSKQVVYKMVEEGQLPSYRIRNQIRVAVADLTQYLRSSKTGSRIAP